MQLLGLGVTWQVRGPVGGRRGIGTLNIMSQRRFCPQTLVQESHHCAPWQNPRQRSVTVKIG